MLDLNRTDKTGELLLGLDKRRGGCVYFYRISGFNEEIRELITECYGAAVKKGAVLNGKLGSPNESQITCFRDMMGEEFRLDKFFIGRSIGRWIPQLNNMQCRTLTDAVYNTLLRVKKLGKTDEMIKNTYILYMCWLNYKFGGILAHIGDNEPPMILYGGNIGRHELFMLRLLYECGCDAVLLQYSGESEYDALDPKGELSERLNVRGAEPFPEGFNLKQLEAQRAQAQRREQLTGGLPDVRAARNVWMTGKDIFDDIKSTPVLRGKEENVFYNAFCRIIGVPDKLTYQNDLYKFYSEIKNSGRKYLIIQKQIPMPTNEELAPIDRSVQKTSEQLVASMLRCIKMPADEKLRRLVSAAYADVILSEAESAGMNPQRLTTMAACTACWLGRYIPILFNGWSMPLVSVFIYLGGCKSSHEAAFLKILSRLPCDVLILTPNLNEKCQLDDEDLYELKYDESLNISEYPTEISSIQIGTAAYHAERELDDMLYNGTGMYRDYQYKKANSVTLRTMFEEIDILWKCDSKIRPNFSVVDDTVNIPVVFAKVSGVKEVSAQKYWKWVQSLVTDNTFIIYAAPFISPNAPNPMKYTSASYIRGGKLRRDAIVNSREYQYSHLRRETQEYIFDKIDLLISSRMIKGTFENGAEYLIAATLLNIPSPILKLLQGFDFTKSSPKLMYINTGETHISAEDSILAAFLNLAGFDVLFLVPTGYQTVEGFFNKSILDEHKVGEYMYDMQLPKLKIPKPKPPASKNKSIFNSLFGKGK